MVDTGEGHRNRGLKSASWGTLGLGKLQVVGVQETPVLGSSLSGRRTSSWGNLLNGGGSKVEYVLQLFLGCVWLYFLRWGGLKTSTEDHRVARQTTFLLRAYAAIQFRTT